MKNKKILANASQKTNAQNLQKQAKYQKMQLTKALKWMKF